MQLILHFTNESLRVNVLNCHENNGKQCKKKNPNDPKPGFIAFMQNLNSMVKCEQHMFWV